MITRTIGSLKHAFKHTFFDHDGIEHAGFLAFLSMLSFFPFLVFLVGLAGLVGELEGSRQIIAEMTALLPERVNRTLAPRLDEILSGPPQGLLTLAVIGIIWTASSVIEGMRGVLNRAYHVTTPPNYVLRRLLSIVQFLTLTILLILGTSALVLVPVALHTVERWLDLDAAALAPAWEHVRYLLAGSLLFLGVAGSYYYLPNIKTRFRGIVPGTLLVLGLWIGAAELFAWYLTSSNQVNVIYGSLGGIIATLLFFYIMSLIYIFGAEFNYYFGKQAKKKRR